MRRSLFWPTWSIFVRGDVYELQIPKGTRGHEQSGSRYGVVVQSDLLPLSTWLIAPTSTSSRDASFRPVVNINGQMAMVLAEQTTAIDPQRLGSRVGHLTRSELDSVEDALLVVFDLNQSAR